MWPSAKTPVRTRARIPGPRLALAGLVAGLGIILSVAVWSRAENGRRAELTSMLGATSDRLTSRIEWQMQREVDGVGMLTRLLRANGGGPANWSLLSGTILQEYPGIDWVAWIGPDSSVIGFAGQDTADVLDPAALKQARFELGSRVASIQERWRDAYELHVFEPVLEDTLLRGVVLGQVQVDSMWVRRQPALNGTYGMSLLSDDGHELPLRVVPDSLTPGWMHMARTITSPSGTQIRMLVIPPDDFVRQVRTRWPLMFLLTGAFLSFAIGTLLVQFLRLRDVHQVLERTNDDLDHRLSDLSRRDEELRRLNEELSGRVQQRTSELEHALREVETFNHSVSHDLRSPIGAILNFAAVLDEDHGPALGPDGQKLLARIHSAAARANRLLDSLAELAAAEVKPGAIRPVDLHAIAERAWSEAVIREGSAEDVVFELGSLPTALGDPVMIERVFGNLFGNALKYSRGRKPRVIQVSSSPGEREFVIQVRDNGTGFEPSRAPDVFEAFRRLHGNEIEGSGLGLAIVAKIITRLGGRVWAESDGATGATFQFTLPAAEVGGA